MTRLHSVWPRPHGQGPAPSRAPAADRARWRPWGGVGCAPLSRELPRASRGAWWELLPFWRPGHLGGASAVPPDPPRGSNMVAAKKTCFEECELTQ
ncbi:large ribosomal subunit protein eL30 isoform 2-T2 [Sylvia borin]